MGDDGALVLGRITVDSNIGMAQNVVRGPERRLIFRESGEASMVARGDSSGH